MSLDHGCHLTHGAKVNFSGRLYNSVQYGLNEATGEVDYDQVEALALEHKPKMIIAGFSAYSRVLDWQRFRDIADQVGATFMCDIAHVAGLIAAGLYPNPVQIADVVTSTTHKTLRGPRGGYLLARERRRITAGDVVRVINALETNNEPAQNASESGLSQTVVQPMLQEIYDDVMARLDAITIDDLCDRARSQGLRRVSDDRLDFTI